MSSSQLIRAHDSEAQQSSNIWSILYDKYEAVEGYVRRGNLINCTDYDCTYTHKVVVSMVMLISNIASILCMFWY